MPKEEKNTSFETGIINLEDLAKNQHYRYQDIFYIEFHPEFKKELYSKIKEVAKTIRNLSKETGISFTRLWDQLTRVPISIEVLNKVSKYLVDKGHIKYSLKNIEKKIFYIKSSGSKSQKIYSPNLPIILKTKEGMRFIAHLYHDGGIGQYNRQPNYTNQSLDEIKGFLKDAQKLFGSFDRKITMWTNPRSKKNYYRISLPTIIGQILIRIGYTPGDKTKNNSPIFAFLENIEDKNLMSEYLTKAFNDDGFVRKRSIGLGQASLIKEKEMPSRVLLLDKLFLEKLNIKVRGPQLVQKYQNRHGLVTKYDIQIYSKKNIQQFYEQIKLIERKNKQIESYLLNWGQKKNS
tara:strand:+ start:28835 stop:29878 length:1044 start_codon:yes stop_codon:yes gene_type:complete